MSTIKVQYPGAFKACIANPANVSMQVYNQSTLAWAGIASANFSQSVSSDSTTLGSSAFQEVTLTTPDASKAYPVILYSTSATSFADTPIEIIKWEPEALPQSFSASTVTVTATTGTSVLAFDTQGDKITARLTAASAAVHLHLQVYDNGTWKNVDDTVISDVGQAFTWDVSGYTSNSYRIYGHAVSGTPTASVQVTAE